MWNRDNLMTKECFLFSNSLIDVSVGIFSEAKQRWVEDKSRGVNGEKNKVVVRSTFYSMCCFPSMVGNVSWESSRNLWIRRGLNLRTSCEPGSRSNWQNIITFVITRWTGSFVLIDLWLLTKIKGNLGKQLRGVWLLESCWLMEHI